ncbi:MAG: hypothetical protein WBA93_27375, partial [Microcoleaceae cyanobacterium]
QKCHRCKTTIIAVGLNNGNMAQEEIILTNTNLTNLTNFKQYVGRGSMKSSISYKFSLASGVLLLLRGDYID